MNKKYLIAIISAVVIVLALILITIKLDQSGDYYQNSLGTASSTSSNNENGSINVITEDGRTVTITPVKGTNSIVPNITEPDLNRSITYPANFTQQQKDDAKLHLDKIISYLKEHSDYFNGWIDLGLYRKLIEDYQGAILAWQYASALQPDNSLPLGNIANLYGYELKNQAMAEDYYNKALAAEPTEEYFYFAFAIYYRDLQQFDKAIAVANRGIKAIPDSLDLRSLLSDLQSEKAGNK